MTTLQAILDEYRTAAASEREKGTYFEELILCYLKNEATYKDLYSHVWTYADWAKEMGLDRRDTGIDLVAKTSGTGEFHAIQCKLYADDYCINRSDLDSFFTASGKKTFSHRLIVSTTNLWTEHAEDALNNQHPAVSKIDLHDLENSQIDWSRYKPQAVAPLKPKKVLREHQVHAVGNTLAGLSSAERGKLIMACGTGKTFTSLKIAESQAGKGGRVLFLVPSLSLLSQTLTEWTQESEIPLHSFAVCSDSDVGKKRKKDDDSVQTFTHELRYPATTDAFRLATEMLKRHDDEHMSVVFSTYHSLAVISDAQHHHALPPFNLVVCDEAHRTTGATFDNEDESTFVRVHDRDFLRSEKRLYMTATPRIYGDLAKATAERDNVALCSMDDESLYGSELHVITFSEAVKRGLLVDYKVIVLSIEESHVIVYTPVEVVDFIIHSVDHVLQAEFRQNLGSEGVHIIDPFTGTGTFITRMLQSGLIDASQMQKKYRREIHANEIVLLAYYIAAVNIEAVYHSLVGGEYETFEGICLADTFQLYEKE